MIECLLPDSISLPSYLVQNMCGGAPLHNPVSDPRDCEMGEDDGCDILLVVLVDIKQDVRPSLKPVLCYQNRPGSSELLQDYLTT